MFDGAIGTPASSQQVSDEFPKRDFLGLSFTNVGISEALAWLRGRTTDSAFAYVVTPNVDHMLNIQKDRQLRQIYEDAGLCLCDSQILARLASFSGLELNVVPGSELVSLLLRGIGAGRSICVIGSSNDIASRLSERLPDVKISCHIPPMGLRHNSEAQTAAVDFIQSHPADYIFLAVGSPQQEILANLLSHRGGIRGTALCVGAAISFFTGESKRAPLWIQTLSLEWAFRLVKEPKRLAYRYLIKGPAIFPLFARWFVTERRKGLGGEQK